MNLPLLEVPGRHGSKRSFRASNDLRNLANTPTETAETTLPTTHTFPITSSSSSHQFRRSIDPENSALIPGLSSGSSEKLVRMAILRAPRRTMGDVAN